MTHLCRTNVYSRIIVFSSMKFNTQFTTQVRFLKVNFTHRSTTHVDVSTIFVDRQDKAYYVFGFSTLSVLLIIVQKQT